MKEKMLNDEIYMLPAIYIDKVNSTPDLTQTDPAANLPGGGADYCGPVSVSNSFIWLIDHGFDNLKPDFSDRFVAQVELARLLGSEEYMNTIIGSGTGAWDLMIGISKYIQDKGYQYKSLKFQGWRRHPSQFSTGVEIPELNWIKSGILGLSGVWLNVGWYKYDSLLDQYERNGGHWVTLVGYGVDSNGNENSKILIVHDPSPRAGSTFSNEYVQMEVIEDGYLIGDNPSVNRSAIGYYKLTGGMHVRSTADFGILDGVVALEMSTEPIPVSSITVTSPNGGEEWLVDSIQNIKWSTVGTVGNVKIQYSVNNGSNWDTINTSTANDGLYTWTVPDKISSACLVKISEASDGSPGDTSDSIFSIVPPITPEITVISPNGGEILKVGSVHPVKWSTSGTVGNVKIQYSVNNGSNWETINASTANDGLYNWIVPAKISSACLIKISEAYDGSPSDTSNSVFTINVALSPEISLNRKILNYGAIQEGSTTGEQFILIENTGSGILKWEIEGDVSWLNTNPASGTGAGGASITVNASDLKVGTYTGTLYVMATGASNSPQTVGVTLTIKRASAHNLPFGEFATPLDDSTSFGSIPVTGWVIDDVEVESVKIYNDTDYIGKAIFVEGARPDIEQAYPDYPMNYKAGWGYMMLTNFLPNGGNGTFNLHAIATDKEGYQITLGTKTIHCDNAHAVKPFGAIDTPTQGGTAAGNNFINWGWVLTPQPNSIPITGSTINVYVNGVNLGHPVYNINRADIAELFPGYFNSNGAIGRYTLDTTAYKNGIHIIQWMVQDSNGNSDGIGSRYFTIQNTSSFLANIKAASSTKPVGAQYFSNLKQILDFPTNNRNSIKIKTGHMDDRIHEEIVSDGHGDYIIKVLELERLVVEFPGNTRLIEAYTIIGNDLRPLPFGSTLDTKIGRFYWQPGVGFLGSYCFVFIEKNDNNQYCKKIITVIIEPKFNVSNISVN